MSLVSHSAKRFHANKSNFSIDHILNVAGRKESVENFQLSEEVMTEEKKFDWLNCTRYRPPKLQKQRKKPGNSGRKLGRNPRIPFSSSQVAFLEARFLRTPYLSSTDVAQLASYLTLSETRVKIWFQNRRAREKREKDSRYSKPKLEVNFKKNAQEIKSHRCLPFDFTKGFSLDSGDSFSHATSPQPANLFQITTSVESSERQIAFNSIKFF